MANVVRFRVSAIIELHLKHHIFFRVKLDLPVPAAYTDWELPALMVFKERLDCLDQWVMMVPVVSPG